MKFRYHYTGNYNETLGKPYLEYETLFLDNKSNKWKTTNHIINDGKMLFPFRDVDKERKLIQKMYGINDYNFYEYEIDIDILKNNPISLLSLKNLIIAKLTTKRYQDYRYRVHLLQTITKEEKRDLDRLDWFGGLDFRMELGILFPDLLEKLYNRHEKNNLFETFRFLLLDYIDFNDLFTDKIKKYHQIIHNKIHKKT